MENKVVLVTGANGFIGKNVVEELKRTNNTVVAVDFVEDVDSLDGVDVVIHLASNTDTRIDHETSHSLNIVDFAMLADLAKAKRVPIVYASSAAVYGNNTDGYIEPLNAYARSKALIEDYAQLIFKQTPCLGLRYFNVYGPGERHKQGYNSMVYQIMDKAKRGEVVKLFKNGEQRRDFVYVDDVVSATIKTAEFLLNPNAGRYLPVDVGYGKSVSFNEVVAAIEKELNVKIDVEYIDNPYSFFQSDTKANIAVTDAVIGYTPSFDIAKGIKAYAENWDKFYGNQ